MLSIMPKGDTFIFTGVAEAFFTYLKVSLIAGILFASPVIIYQLWMFVAPGLYLKEKRLLMPLIILSGFFFVAGSLFGYFFVFPTGFKFFQGYANDTIRFMPSVSQYLSFASKMLLAFGVVFELPIVLVGLSRIGVVTVSFLNKNRKYAILLIFIAAAILTPGPDVFSQLMMALPLMFLYEISILGAFIFGKKKKEEENDEDQMEIAVKEKPENQ